MTAKRRTAKTGNGVKTPRLPRMDFAAGEGLRRLPVYLLLDTSGSMAGTPIEALRRGVDLFKSEIKKDAFAEQTVHVGVITFGGDAVFTTRGLIPFDSFVDSFQPATLSANGQTPLGQALWLLSESLDKDVKTGIKGGEKGDWKPMVFILTDGKPTDDWQKPRLDILNRLNRKVINAITVGCGPYIDQRNLRDIAIGSTFNMGSDDASFRVFFLWITQSVVSASRTVSALGGGDKTVKMPPPPDEIRHIQ